MKSLLTLILIFILFSCSFNNDEKLSKSSVEKSLNQFFKNQPAEEECNLRTKYRSKLIELGYIQPISYFQSSQLDYSDVDVTEKGRKYFISGIPTEYGGMTHIRFNVGKLSLQDITGIITDKEKKQARVDFTMHKEANILASEVFEHAGLIEYKLIATFILYDDGWRLDKIIDNNSGHGELPFSEDITQ